MSIFKCFYFMFFNETHAVGYGPVHGARLECEQSTRGDCASVGHAERDVGRNASVASTDEGRSDGENFTWGEGYIKCRRDRSSRDGKDVENGLVASLDCQDGCSGSEEDRVGQKRGTAEISHNADVFDDSCGSCHGLDGCQSRCEVELASRDRRSS